MKVHFLKLIVTFFCVPLLVSCISAKQTPPEPILTSNEVLLNAFHSVGLEAEELPKGVVVYFPSVMFQLGSADVTTQSLSKIQYVADISNKTDYAARKIAIEGHTDSKGSEAFNLELSKNRAVSVANTLNTYQLSQERLTIAWHGELMPRVPNELSNGSDNPEGRATNRRVEIVFLN